LEDTNYLNNSNSSRNNLNSSHENLGDDHEDTDLQVNFVLFFMKELYATNQIKAHQ